MILTAKPDHEQEMWVLFLFGLKESTIVMPTEIIAM